MLRSTHPVASSARIVRSREQNKAEGGSLFHFIYTKEDRVRFANHIFGAAQFLAMYAPWSGITSTHFLITARTPSR